MMQAPKVDKRTSREITRDVSGLLPVYVKSWPVPGEGGELADALIHVFARYGEIIVDRLNKTPEKNFRAFLDLLGISPLPLQAARAPVTFYLAAGGVSHAAVPAGTQVAAAPGPGEQKPVIFETEKELIVVSAKLESLVIKDGGHDQYTDFSGILTPPSPPSGGGTTTDVASAPPAGNVIVIPHALYVPLPEYTVWPAFSQIRLKVGLESDLAAPVDPRTLRWELCVAKPTTAVAPGPAASPPPGDDGIKTIVLEPLQDGTENLTKSGDVVFLNLPEVPLLVLGDSLGHWLRCRLLAPITRSTGPTAGMVRETQLPGIKTLSMETSVKRTGLGLEQAFFSSVKLDLSKDFFPFGPKPKFGDTLYLGSREAFSNPDAVLTLHVAVTNPATSGVDTPLPAAKPQDVRLRWEFWDGKAWTELTGGEPIARRVRIRIENLEAPETPVSDGTQAFSVDGDISLKFPKPPAELNLNGQKNYWIRVRIVAGDYGKEAHYEQVRPGLVDRELHREGGFHVTPATFAPPSIRSVKVDYAVKTESQPEAVLTYNDFAYSKINPQSGTFRPFIPTPPDQVLPALYLGFTLPTFPTGYAAVFPNRAMSAYVGMAAIVAGPAADPSIASASASWEYWNGSDWMKWTVLDDTQGIRRAGLIRFIAPADFALSEQFGQSRYWLRMRQNDPQFQPNFSHVLLNTTMAVQGSTISNEILGASNETPGQQFQTTQTPVLAGQKLEVRESTQPSWHERAQIQAREGDEAITRGTEPTGKGESFWVRWHEVPNFYGSGARDRDYVIDRMSGEVTFGDGTNGMIPPALPGNIRLSYRTGGGVAGNKPADAITQLKSSIPYIQKASNCEAASGGTDAEPDAALLERGPLDIRHGGRAVTREDYEDLARAASREVARAKCVPLFDLTQDPDAKKKKPGVVSVIIVPRSTDPKPRPSLDLFERVRSYIDASRQLTGDLKLVGPEYLRVDVECEIAVLDPEAASEVEHAAKTALENYLHPVTGGADGNGWDFGREPKRSDFFGLLEGVPGISHVRELFASLIADRPGSVTTGRFLICGGNHKVTTTLEE